MKTSGVRHLKARDILVNTYDDELSEIFPTNILKFKDDIIEDRFYRSVVDDIVALNKNVGEINEDTYLLVPPISKLKTSLCKTTKDKTYDRYDKKGKVKIPKGSYLCKNSIYSEYVIGVLCSNLLRQGKSVNFMDFIGFATCNKLSEYIFMEKMDNNLKTIGECLFKNGGLNEDIKRLTIDNILIQILHAICTYQTYQIQHNDLHSENIMVEYIKEGSTFMGQDVYSADWFHYKIEDVDLYVPFIPMLVKIGDFGYSVKYSNPIVGFKGSLKYGFNYFDKSYDIHKLVNDLDMTDLFEGNESYIKIRNYFFQPGKNMEISFGGRANPEYLLKNKDIFGKYMNKPKIGKIVTLGEI